MRMMKLTEGVSKKGLSILMKLNFHLEYLLESIIFLRLKLEPSENPTVRRKDSSFLLKEDLLK
jgi:hypothetical protein